MEYVLDGYCGLYCGACPMMLDTITGKGPTPCHGCKSEQPAGHCAECVIKACARSKGYDFCDLCAELASCEKMNGFMSDPEWPYHQGVLKNFVAIRAVGKDQWLQDQKNRWQCSACGTQHSWWDETCPQCGEMVENYKADLEN